MIILRVGARSFVRVLGVALAVAAIGPGWQLGSGPLAAEVEVPPTGELPANVTFNRDIAPLLHANCATCHHAGEVAPFSLLTYQDAAKRADWIREVTQRRAMPPWKAEPNFGRFQDELRLDDREIELIAAWAKAGAPQGDEADLPPMPQFPVGWRLGEPDLVIEMPEPFTVPADGGDIFHYFVMPMELSEDRHVRAVEFRPGNRSVVHHSIFFLDQSGAARKLDAAEAGPGYRRFGGPGFLPSGNLGGWAPGYVPRPLPDGIGRPVKKGSDLVMQLHYHPTGKTESDRSKVGIYFSRQPVKQAVAGMALAYRQLDIPPGEKNYTVNTSFTLPVDVELLGVTPHMHLLGRSMKAVAGLPDGRVEPLVWIKNWDWNWQNQYRYVEHIKLPKGTKLELEAVYDNSADNPANPNSPPKRVTWGQETKDEMCFLFIDVVTEKPEDLITLRQAQIQAAVAARPDLLKRFNLAPAGK